LAPPPGSPNFTIAKPRGPKDRVYRFRGTLVGPPKAPPSTRPEQKNQSKSLGSPPPALFPKLQSALAQTWPAGLCGFWMFSNCPPPPPLHSPAPQFFFQKAPAENPNRALLGLPVPMFPGFVVHPTDSLRWLAPGGFFFPRFRSRALPKFILPQTSAPANHH